MESTENQEPKFLNIDFEIGDYKYNYNFNKMKASQVLAAIKYFKIELALEDNLPKNPSEIEVIAQRQVQRYAVSAMINKYKKDSDDLEVYSEAKPPAFAFLDELEGADNFTKLMEARQDFFYHTGLINIELTKVLPDLIKQLNELNEVERAQIFKMIAISQNSPSSRTNAKNITQKKGTGKN